MYSYTLPENANEYSYSLPENANSAEEELHHYEPLNRKTLESAKSNERKQTKTDHLEKKIGHLEEESAKRNEKETTKIDQLEKKIEHLEKERRELEERLYPSAIASYSINPKLASIIEIKTRKEGSRSKTRPILGMTILRTKLYVVTGKSSEIEVYDSVTWTSEPTWQIAVISNPLDIAACTTNDCLYICDGKANTEIFRFDSCKTYLNKWFIEGDAGQLSVTREGNVVVTLFNGNKIIEYSPDGQLVREVRLSPIDNISHPWHAIKTTSMHFVFSHGMGDDTLHRVCAVKADGTLLKSFGERKGSKSKEKEMNCPVHLLADSSHNVLVVDMQNNRVLMLSPTLEYTTILVSAADKSKLRFPMRTCLDEERGILFVADNNYKKKKKGVYTYDSGQIFVFKYKT